MKTGIIPDIHTNYQKAQRMVDFIQADKYVFLGDYFDNYGDSPEANFDTAIWVENRMETNPKDEWCLGNHDVQYVWGIEQCSGFSHAKKLAIQASGTVHILQRNLKLFTVVDGILLSHAGLTEPLVPKNRKKDLISWLNHECVKAKFNFKEGVSHWTVSAGMDRGGYSMYGGLTWGDWGSFKPIKGTKQICGHTKGYLPRHWDGNHCIDTALHHYAIIEDGKISIHSFEDEILSGVLVS